MHNGWNPYLSKTLQIWVHVDKGPIKLCCHQRGFDQTFPWIPYLLLVPENKRSRVLTQRMEQRCLWEHLLQDQIHHRLNKQNPSKPTLPWTTTPEGNYCKNSTNAWLKKICTGEKKLWIQWLTFSNLNTRYFRLFKILRRSNAIDFPP